MNVGVFLISEDTYTKEDAIDNQAVTIRIMDTAHEVCRKSYFWCTSRVQV